MSEIVLTALDKNGNLIKKGTKEVKNVKIIRLSDDPFLWTDIVRKNTGNRETAFCKKFLKDNKFDIDKMNAINSWFVEYYTAFLMELSKVICDLGTPEIKAALHRYFKMWGLYSKEVMMVIEDIPDEINEDTKAGIISDAFSSFTNIGFLLITEE